jgi:hypothetical protein
VRIIKFYLSAHSRDRDIRSLFRLPLSLKYAKYFFKILSKVFVFVQPVDKVNCCRKLKMIENAHFAKMLHEFSF